MCWATQATSIVLKWNNTVTAIVLKRTESQWEATRLHTAYCSMNAAHGQMQHVHNTNRGVHAHKQHRRSINSIKKRYSFNHAHHRYCINAAAMPISLRCGMHVHTHVHKQVTSHMKAHMLHAWIHATYVHMNNTHTMCLQYTFIMHTTHMQHIMQS